MSSLSSPEEISEDEFLALVNEDKFDILSPTDVGHRFRQSATFGDGYPCHILKLEVPEPVVPTPEELRAMGRWQAERVGQRLRMVCDVPPESMARFSMDDRFDYTVVKRITKAYDMGSITEWVHTQTAGRWSIQVFGDKDKRPGRSFLRFYFEDPTAAVLFKMFQI